MNWSFANDFAQNYVGIFFFTILSFVVVICQLCQLMPLEFSFRKQTKSVITNTDQRSCRTTTSATLSVFLSLPSYHDEDTRLLLVTGDLFLYHRS